MPHSMAVRSRGWGPPVGGHCSQPAVFNNSSHLGSKAQPQTVVIVFHFTELLFQCKQDCEVDTVSILYPRKVRNLTKDKATN